MKSTPRPLLLCLFFAGCICMVLSSCQPAGTAFRTGWPTDLNRTWVGPEYWANRLQDWHIADGRLETTVQAKGKPMRTLHLLTRRLGAHDGSLNMQVEAGWIDAQHAPSENELGFLIGAGSTLDYRAAALIHHSSGPGAGIFVGTNQQGTLFIRNLSNDAEELARSEQVNLETPLEEVRLALDMTVENAGHTLTLSLYTAIDGPALTSVSYRFPEEADLAGNLALVSSQDQTWFRDWRVDGTRLEVHPGRTAGPVLNTQYTLSKDILKMTAQMMPVGEEDAQTVTLEVKDEDAWREVASTSIITPGYTAPFRVENWERGADTPYRVVYDYAKADGSITTYLFHGTVKQDPVDQPVVSVAGFTGNHNTGRGVEGGNFRWIDRVWFPHNDIVNNIKQQDVDVLFFSGDQVYEGASPTFPDRENAHLDYLYKWYLWGWAFRDITKDRPTITIPDDHDVYQGNIWGNGGPAVPVDNMGGYVMPADWVKMIERTQTSHLPDPYDPTPIKQGIGVYYTSMTYGRVGIAILEDRKFKSGCYGLVPGHEGRPDHFSQENFTPAMVDKPGLTLLGDRQLTFIDDWAADWRGQDMKLAVSQTVFANMATHHGPNLMRLYADLDSNGWPKRGRDSALRALRRGFAFMLQGDQHLSTIVHHGVDAHNDAGYSFCVPSIANFYPRGWQPEEAGENRPEGAPAHYGQHQDAFGNFVTVYGATNPTGLTGISTEKEPLALHDRMPGYGIVRFNKTDRTITMENWPRYAKPMSQSEATQYEGWPKTIAMEDNYGREAAGYLPALRVSGLANPVVQVVEEATGEIVYTLRIQGDSFRPKVFAQGRYTVHVGNQDAGEMQTFSGVTIAEDEVLEVIF
ncbi:MAG: alkaline phosphatase D family protein [Bacteroidota bacterium]